MSSKKNCCSENSTDDKLKILALHGHRQNGEMFRQKTGSFRKIIHKWVQFTFITAPHKVISVENESKNDTDIGAGAAEDQFSWFFNREDNTFRGIRKGGPAIGFEESLKLVENAFKEFGPFDGILGFSQGACFTGLLCDLQQRGLLNFRFDFAVLVSGFKSYSLPHLKYYSETIKLPSVHIFGEQDDIIPKELSEELRDAFEDPTTIVHPGKHYLPASAPQKIPYQSFFKQMALQKYTKLS